VTEGCIKEIFMFIFIKLGWIPRVLETCMCVTRTDSGIEHDDDCKEEREHSVRGVAPVMFEGKMEAVGLAAVANDERQRRNFLRRFTRGATTVPR